MAYELRIDQKAGYLHCTVTGRNTRDNVTRYMAEVMEACTARGCPRVLIEERLEGPRLGTMDVFTMVTAGSKRFHGVLDAMAYVDLNADEGVMRFAEDVAVNRGIPVRVFRTVEGAEKWLKERLQDGGAASPPEGASEPPGQEP